MASGHGGIHGVYETGVDFEGLPAERHGRGGQGDERSFNTKYKLHMGKYGFVISIAIQCILNYNYNTSGA